VLSGLTGGCIIPLIVGFVLLFGTLFFLRSREGSYRIPDSANVNQAAE